MNLPEFEELRLQNCCQAPLRDMRRRIDIARLLRASLVAGPFVTMFGAHPLSVLYTILFTDWNGLVSSVGSVDAIIRRRCRQVAHLHSLQHPGGDLNRFWTALGDSFI